MEVVLAYVLNLSRIWAPTVNEEESEDEVKTYPDGETLIICCSNDLGVNKYRVM